MRRFSCIIAGLLPGLILAALPASTARGEAMKVELRQQDGHWQLLRGGQPYFIKGAGGDHAKQVLKDLGGNSFRTWGADHLEKQLDEAQRLGLTVTVGIWLGHERHGFNYADPKQVQAQFEMAQAVVRKYKDHPAVLLWGVGNEMEGNGSNPLIWKAVDEIAAMIKREDPNHPTMTVFQENVGDRVGALNKYCSHIDIAGLNTYGGGPTVAERYRKAGGTKPFIVTEFGPTGMWEIKQTDWGAPIEPTSTQKAAHYRATYEKSVLGEQGKLCLGSYAFIWGHKQEGSTTWFGLFLPTGERVAATNVLSELWTGKPLPNRCPEIKPLKLEPGEKADAGQTIRATVDVTDPQNDPLSIEWSLTGVPDKYVSGGDTQPKPQAFPDAIAKNGGRAVEIRMPAKDGEYWLYCIVRDGHGGAATACAPLLVNKAVALAPKGALPLVVYGDDRKGGEPYAASGWMGNHTAIEMDETCTDNPRAGKTCMKLQYKAAGDFGGVVWQSPANDWGDQDGGLDLSGAKRLTFWARGADGGERVEFKFGILGPDKKFPDTGSGTSGPLTLKKDWTRYTIDLGGRNLARIKTGFCWVLAGQGKPVTFYLDDVRYE